MILIGQFDSPFVRRVGIALDLYGLAVEHRPWSSFGDAERIAAFNPLRRVPTLVLDDGEALIESGAILDHLDQTVGPARAMLPATGAARRTALRHCALATGVADKAASLVYERVLHPAPSDVWLARCRAQIGDGLDALEASRAAAPGAFLGGDTIGHADVALACTLRFVVDAHPALLDPARWPALLTHAAHCEGLPAFQRVSQAFIPPA